MQAEVFEDLPHALMLVPEWERVAGRRRRSLYAAALPAAFRWHTALKALYRRLTERGKPHAVAQFRAQRRRGGAPCRGS